MTIYKAITSISEVTNVNGASAWTTAANLSPATDEGISLFSNFGNKLMVLKLCLG